MRDLDFIPPIRGLADAGPYGQTRRGIFNELRGKNCQRAGNKFVIHVNEKQKSALSVRHSEVPRGTRLSE